MNKLKISKPDNMTDDEHSWWIAQGWTPDRQNVREYRQTTDDCDWSD